MTTDLIDRLETRSRSIQHGKSRRSAPEVFSRGFTARAANEAPHPTQEKFQIPKLGNSCKFSQFRDNIGEKLGTKLPKLGKFWEVEPLLRSQKRDFFGTI